MQEEIWKDIKGYEGLYQVSNLGNVKSLKYRHSNQPKQLSYTLDAKGYLHVRLAKKCKKSPRIHRLVAETFIPNPYNYPQVNHIDGNKENNCVDNLEWCDNSYNQKHAYELGLQKPKNTSPVIQYDKNMNFLNYYKSINEAKRIYGEIAISHCCRGKRKLAGGYIWKYAD